MGPLLPPPDQNSRRHKRVASPSHRRLQIRSSFVSPHLLLF
jgi:hypothetical protein